MAVTEQTPRNVSTATPGATVFPYDFKIIAGADMLVQVDDVTKTLGVDYTISGVGLDIGGNVTFSVPMAGGEVVVRKRQMPLARETDYQNLGDLRSQTLNNDQDAPVMMIQQLADDQSRALSLPLSSTASAELPDIVPLHPLVGKADGTGFEFGSTVLTGDMLLRGDLASPDPLKGDALVAISLPYSGAALRSLDEKLPEIVSVLDFEGVTGDGVSSDQLGFLEALDFGGPVHVPWTQGHYVLTSLTSEQRSRLWGPGRVKVGGVDVNIASSPRMFGDATASHVAIKPNWQPAQFPGVQGSIGNGSADDDLTRTGGFGTYGMALKRLHVTAAVPTGQFDVADTAWAGATNLTGGQIFGNWRGANTPARYLGQTYSGGAAIGQEVNVGNRWSDFGLQTDVGGTRYTSGQQIVPDVIPAKDGDNLTTVTSITIASPGVVTVTAHGFTAGIGVVFTGSGTLPGGLVKDTTYFVLATGITADTFRVAATPGGTAINTTGSFVGPISVRPAWPGTFGQVIGASVHGHRWWTGTLLRLNSIMPGGYGHYAGGGLVADQAPAAWMKAIGCWDRGIDMRGCLFSTYGIDFQSAQYASGSVINFDFTASHTTTATAGGVAIPSGFQGYIKATMSGSPIAIPYLLRP